VQPRRHRPNHDEESRFNPHHRHCDQDPPANAIPLHRPLEENARPPNHQHDDDARPPRRPHDVDDKFGKLKFTMPKFMGDDDADAYLSWAIKVDKIFRVHNYSEERKVAMASLEFEGYANVWWQQVVAIREDNLQEPIATWEEMKIEMHKRFIPNHYNPDLLNKLQKLTQGTKSVQEYFKEMEMTMMRIKLDE
jgi:hypothetical protein